MRELTFFKRHGGAGTIRGAQVASYLGAKLNPKGGYKKDVCIFVKVIPPEDFPVYKTYLDVVDAAGRNRWIQNHRDVGAIAISKMAQQWISECTGRNDIVFIPEHHCNFERELRPEREIKRAGAIGGYATIQCDVNFLKEELGKMNLEFQYDLPFYKYYKTREQVIEFYRGIDIQIVWRPHFDISECKLKNPLKLENAGSYGIPTVCFPEESYIQEWDGCFIPAYTTDDIIDGVRMLKEDESVYREFSEKARIKAEEYHIEHISKLYRDLGKDGIMELRMKAVLLDKEVIANGEKIQVYGLAHFSVTPRQRELGRWNLKGFEDIAKEDGKYCIVAFCDDKVLPFYSTCGWSTVGRRGELNIISSIPLNDVLVEEQW